ncbi:MAG TPA: PQQ-binding-like beta-propeller repeat protein [Pyrinomonadaceae bacterium]|jgi:outer membrane protein assembly factor BamB
MMSYLRCASLRASLLPALLLVICLAPQALAQGGGQARQVTQSTVIRWNAQPGINRYRLQLARDERFTDIVFDRAVTGHEYTVTELPSGSYYWRVAPAAGETGAYSSAVPVLIGGAANDTANNTTPRTVRPADNTGWRTATGNVAQPLAVHLRDASSFDLVGVNSDGMVYALDGANGVALWTARFRPKAKRGEPTGSGGGAAAFTPVIVSAGRGLANVVVAFEGGVRALEGATGRELWRATLTGKPTSGISADFGGEDGATIFIADNSPSLSVLSGNTGKVLTQTKLDAAALGSPAAYAVKSERGVVLALEGGILEMRKVNGERANSIKLDTKITTPPFVVTGSHGTMVLVGSESGLISLDATDLRPLGRIATEDDAPRGTLTAADLDADGSPEVVMITRRGRTVVISTINGKIKWYANGATDADAAAFADLDGDNTLDVLVAAGPAFALGLSGRDGSVIWKAEDDSRQAAGGATQATGRSLVAATVGSGHDMFVVGSDPSRIGLRAVGLPKGAVKTANK